MKITDRERDATLQHYDQDPRIFETFLDRSMKYSSAIFEEGDDLDAAQARKMAYVAECLDAAPGKEMLDVGCGWGSLVLHLAQSEGCRVTGLTPAPRQAEVVERRALERGLREGVSVRVGNFQEQRFERGRFDGISFLGSIVHMEDRAGILGECHRLLRRGGRIYVSESCFRNEGTRAAFMERPGSRFVRESIFGWGDMVPISTIIRAIEDAGFSLVALRDLTKHYYRTIEAWSARVRERRDELERIRSGLADSLLHYFEVANTGWGFTTKHYAVVAAKTR